MQAGTTCVTIGSEIGHGQVEGKDRRHEFSMCPEPLHFGCHSVTSSPGQPPLELCFLCRAGSTSSKTTSESVDPRAAAISDFWLSEEWSTAKWDYFLRAQSKVWFSGKPETDASIRSKFAQDLEDIAAGKLDSWLLSSPQDTLAGVILMDQLARCVQGRVAQNGPKTGNDQRNKLFDLVAQQ